MYRKTYVCSRCGHASDPDVSAGARTMKCDRCRQHMGGRWVGWSSPAEDIAAIALVASMRGNLYDLTSLGYGGGE